IFEITTAEGSVSSFLTFAKRYPEGPLAKKARLMAFHLLAGQDEPEWPAGLLNDSLQSLLEVNSTYLVPFFKNNRYGFMDETGREVIAPKYHSIHSDYLCGYITDEVLIADGQLVARN